MPLFQVVDKPYLFPQACGFCGNPAEKPVIDTGVIVPGLNEGRLYMCFDCMDDAARVAGYSTRAEVEETQAENVKLQERVDLLPIQIRKAAHDITDIADRVVRGLLPDIAPVDVSLPPQLDFAERPINLATQGSGVTPSGQGHSFLQ